MPTLRAVLLTEPGAAAVDVVPQKDDSLLWSKVKYRMCLACYPTPASSDGIAMFMRQRFFNPEQCEESDLHPLVFPPPLSHIVVYGPALFVSVKNDTVGPLTLAAWKAAWQQMHTHSWQEAGDGAGDNGAGDNGAGSPAQPGEHGAPPPGMDKSEEEDDGEEEEEEEEEEDSSQCGTDDEHSSNDTSYEESENNTTDTGSDASESDVEGPTDMFIPPEEFAAPEPRKRQRRYTTRSTLRLDKGLA